MTRAERNYIRAVLLVCFLILPGLECKAQAQDQSTWENSVIVIGNSNLSFATSRDWEPGPAKVPTIRITGTSTTISREWTETPASGSISVEDLRMAALSNHVHSITPTTWTTLTPREPEVSWLDHIKQVIDWSLITLVVVGGVLALYLMLSTIAIQLIAYSGPPNVFERADTNERFVLPEPNDPRWMREVKVLDGKNEYLWKLGTLEIGDEIRVDGDELKVWPSTRVRRYYVAIGKDWVSRQQGAIQAKAEKQITGDT